MEGRRGQLHIKAEQSKGLTRSATALSNLGKISSLVRPENVASLGTSCPPRETVEAA